MVVVVVLAGYSGGDGEGGGDGGVKSGGRSDLDSVIIVLLKWR